MPGPAAAGKSRAKFSKKFFPGLGEVIPQGEVIAKVRIPAAIIFATASEILPIALGQELAPFFYNAM